MLQRIDKLQEETQSLLQKFKKVNKEIQGLRVYNARLEKQLENQLRLIAELDESIANVTVIERQIQPLILRMLEGLEQFVASTLKRSMKMRHKSAALRYESDNIIFQQIWLNR